MNSRRNFLKTLGRGLAAGTILGTAGYLLLRAPGSENCDFDFPCKNCKKLTSCNDQKVRDFRGLKSKSL